MEREKHTSFSAEELNIWQLGPRPDILAKGPRRRVEFGAVGDVKVEEDNTSFISSHPQQKLVADQEKVSDNGKGQSTIIGVVHLLCENVLLHPLVVIRRQCQVSRRSFKYHWTPFTVIPVLVRLESKQGLNSLWKGVGSVLITRGLLMVTESFLSEVAFLNKDLSNCKLSLENVARHLLLKAVAFTVITPFFCSSCIETVQSSIACETPGIFDCLTEGFARFIHWRRSHSTRLLPFWIISGPTVMYHLLHYTVVSTSKSVILWWKSKDSTENETPQNESPEYSEVTATMYGNLAADVLLFPLETIIHRLYLQGTRTLIDNVDHSHRVIPVISDYDGLVDCYHNIVSEEGCGGLFKGFGALVLQYSLHFLVLRLTKTVLQKVVQ